MVRLIQLPHLADRVKGMLFQVRFRQNFDLLKEVSRNKDELMKRAWAF